MKITPILDRVVIEPSEAETITSGGIIIPDGAKEKPVRGTILACGTEAKEVNVGDVVLYGKHAGTEIDVDGKTVIIMREGDIFAIL